MVSLLGLSWSQLQTLRIILLLVEVCSVALPHTRCGDCSARENGSCAWSWKMGIIADIPVNTQAEISSSLRDGWWQIMEPMRKYNFMGDHVTM